MEVKIALAGNPNCGKTTMFNDLTGSNQYVGNWPGVTVEKKEGRLKGSPDVVIQDLPGIYSLSPYTMEEVISRSYLVHEKPDAILNIVDGSNIERNLYLTTQLMEIGIPMVIALNMMDIVRKTGDKIDVAKLSETLGCAVIETDAMRGEGSSAVVQEAVKAARSGQRSEHPHVFGGTVEHALAHIEDIIGDRAPQKQLRWFSVKLFERDEKVIEELKLGAQAMEKIEKTVSECEKELDDDAESIITNERYAYIAQLVEACVRRTRKLGDMTTSDKIDRIVTNRVLALPIFALVMFIVYFVSVTTVGAIVTDFTNDVLFGEWILGGLGGWLENIGAAGWLSGLLTDGIVGGVGAVLGFVPQMLVLFLFLAVLEDVGYMARVAFIMDKIFHRFGLSGKSFIPMLIGSGCSVPGVMASRTIENERDRRMTIMTTSFIPCGAKMPIVALFAGAVFGGAWWVAPAAYFIGVAAVITSGVLLKKTRMFAGAPAPFVMELPIYHIPSAKNVFHTTVERGWSFIKRAGTVILLASLVIWFLSGYGFIGGTFGYLPDTIEAMEESQLAAEGIEEPENYMDHSVLATVGNVVAPIFRPLGFADEGQWQPTVATVMGLVAKEEVVGVFGVLFGVEGDALELVDGEDFEGLSPVAAHFTTLSAFSFLLFNLLCAPCFAAMGAIRREMNSAKWTCFAIGYLCVFAYAVSLIVFQLGTLFSGGGFGVGTVAAFIVLAGLLVMVFRPATKENIVRTGVSMRA